MFYACTRKVLICSNTDIVSNELNCIKYLKVCDLYNILLLASFFGVVLTTLLFLKKCTNTKATVFLGSFYLILSFYALHTYIIDGGRLATYPGFFLWPLVPFNLIFVPIFFYFVTIIEDHFKWKQSYFLLFLPFVLAVIDVGYIYLQPEKVYADLFQDTVTDPKNRLKVDYLLLSLNEHLLIRHTWQFLAQLILFPKLLEFIKQGNGDKLKIILNKWLLFFWAILMLMSIVAILYAIEKMLGISIFNFWMHPQYGSTIVTFILYMVVFSIGVVPIYFPTILHGYPQTITSSSDPEKVSGQEMEDKFGLDETEIIRKLQLLVQKKVHLRQNFNVTSCAREMEMPAHHLSYFIKQHFGLSFTAYKNNLRMEHAKILLGNGYLENNTMEALAWECGFASRSSFSRAFKSATGLSPSEYEYKTKKDK